MPVDPVCKMTVSRDTDMKFDYEGETYYFCNPTCLQKFKEDPVKFLMPELKIPEPAMQQPVKVSGRSSKVILPISGMTCASCASTVEKALNGLPGVAAAAVNFAAEKATIEFDPAVVGREKMKAAVESVGYGVMEEAEEEGVSEMVAARKRLFWVWAITIPIIGLMIPEMFFGLVFTGYHYLMVVLAALVLAFPGYKTYRSALRSITLGSANMDVLIFMGTLASFGTGVARLLGLPIASYAGISAMIMAFHLTGRYVEATAKGRASQAIRKLLELGAKSALI
ncbi:MAG: cation transporter, partial [bacterium]